MVTVLFEKMGDCNLLSSYNIKRIFYIGVLMLMFSVKDITSLDNQLRSKEIHKELEQLMNEKQEENAWRNELAHTLKQWMEKQQKIITLVDEDMNMAEEDMASINEQSKKIEKKTQLLDEDLKRSREKLNEAKEEKEKILKNVISLDEWVMSAMEGDTEILEEYGYIELKEQQLEQLSSMDKRLKMLEKNANSSEEISKKLKEIQNAISQKRMKIQKKINARNEELKILKDEMEIAEKKYEALFESQKREDL